MKMISLQKANYAPSLHVHSSKVYTLLNCNQCLTHACPYLCNLFSYNYTELFELK